MFGFKRWIVYNGPPDDLESEVIYELDDKEYRKYVKGLPLFKKDAVFTARMAFVPATAKKAPPTKKVKG